MKFFEPNKKQRRTIQAIINKVSFHLNKGIALNKNNVVEQDWRMIFILICVLDPG